MLPDPGPGATGTMLIREGDPGDACYAIAAGQLDVTQDGHLLRRCGRGEGGREGSREGRGEGGREIALITSSHLRRITRGGHSPFALSFASGLEYDRNRSKISAASRW